MAKLSAQNQKNKAGNSSSNTNVNNSTTAVKKVKRTRRSVPRDSPPQRSSIYRGVTRHRWTGRYEAHLWDKNCWNESQSKKGRQVYLGAYVDEDAAAHAYDLAALKYWGQETILNFPLSTYEKELKEMDGLSREEYIGSLRRKSSGFSRGVSKYRGVARHHHNGRWEARIGRVFGNKYLYLGTYATQEEAATAYDMAAIEYRGLNAVTNFDLSRYIKWLKPNIHNNDNVIYNIPDVDIINPNADTNLSPNPNEELGLISNLLNNPTYINISTPEENNLQLTQPQHTSSSTTSATSALGLLLQSSKFREMMEMTSTADEYTPSIPSQCTFPDDIQTYFDCLQDSSTVYAEGDDTIFDELNSMVPSIFNYDLDA
ncbi:AP2-like ethylene-responsive transcription factor At1g16060 [Juglans microcarpa x Juglans regia]|uniref:AP2-like ethylene-responsive transcription factor At1g16060 n=1 Tax=Juglans microcarpa x Juglans regia TaxID=2249226 RepID=UPI001B7F5EF6|nr:AP2-like ethylene-responsive transcription factor At1g16060 [Juglans microcarpa x Juglans regia]